MDMKIHISNLYNFNSGDELVTTQHRVADVARALGFREMGIFDYPVETDSATELSRRLDGVIGALEADDMVFVQLPTKNGYAYESMLLHKIKAYRNTKIAIILHEMQFDTGDEKEKYLELLKMADVVVVSTQRMIPMLKACGIPKIISGELLGMKEDFLIKKVLIDAREAMLGLDNCFMEMEAIAAHTDADEVHIGFGIYDKTGNYSVWLGVAMQSIIENTKSAVCFHVLHDNTLSDRNKERLLQVAINGGQRIEFHLLDKNMFLDFEEQMENYTIGALFRIMLPEVLPHLPKIIYLDADIMAHRDIKELWDIDISEYCLAAVPDIDVVNELVRPIAIKRNEVPANRYFNSGVICMNLDNIRKKGNMRQEIVRYLDRTRESNLPDQDALNVVYLEDTLLLDGIWNTFVRPQQDKAVGVLEQRIYHFVGTRCILYSMSAVDRLYYETIARTPWKDIDCNIYLDKALNRITDRVDQLEKLLRCCADGKKKRIFYGEETFGMRNLYKILTLRDGDYRIGDPNEHMIYRLEEVLPCREVSVLSEEKDPFVVFVLPEADHGMAIPKLEKLGLVNGIDFFVIPRLLPPGLGGYM